MLQGGFPSVPFKTLCLLPEHLNPQTFILPLKENLGLLSLLQGAPHWTCPSLQVPLWYWGHQTVPSILMWIPSDEQREKPGLGGGITAHARELE